MVWWFRAVIPDFYHVIQNVKRCEFHDLSHPFLGIYILRIC
jgi:hypothetical protein